MLKKFLEILACPDCQGGILLKEVGEKDQDRIKTGTLICDQCKATYPIVEYIPRFVPVENYAGNFGYQWNIYTEAQYDSHLGVLMADSRFYEMTNWPRKLDG